MAVAALPPVLSARSSNSSEYADDYRHTAFEDPAAGTDESAVAFDMETLQQALLALQDVLHSAPPRSAPVKATADSHAHKRKLMLSFADALVRRDYDDSPCTTLLISFGSLQAVEEDRHEFVGAARRAGARHTLFLRDPLQAWYLRGGSTSSDPFASTWAIIALDIKRLRPSRVVCIGASMGGYGAARCGMAIGAASSTVEYVEVLAFGPQIFLHPSERTALHLPEMSFDSALDRLYRAASKAVPGRDAARVLAFPLASLVCLAAELHRQKEATPTAPSVRVQIHVGSQAPSDVKEVRRVGLREPPPQ